MIHVPRRSVTRFFIPLIDVLTLLFCIFLLMPLVKATGDVSEVEASPAGAGLSAQERQDLERLRKAEEQWRQVKDLSKRESELRETLQELRKEKLDVFTQRLAIRVLEIEKDKLFFYDPDREENRRIQITKDNVATFIKDQKRKAGTRDLYFLILYPRRASGFSGFPRKQEFREYEAWFADVPHSYDIPYQQP